MTALEKRLRIPGVLIAIYAALRIFPILFSLFSQQLSLLTVSSLLAPIGWLLFALSLVLFKPKLIAFGTIIHFTRLFLQMIVLFPQYPSLLTIILMAVIPLIISSFPWFFFSIASTSSSHRKPTLYLLSALSETWNCISGIIVLIFIAREPGSTDSDLVNLLTSLFLAGILWSCTFLAQRTIPSKRSSSANSGDITTRLNQLHKLKEQELISEDEYTQKKRELLALDKTTP